MIAVKREKEFPLFRTKGKVVQAILSPNYTPITNLDILTAASKAMDMAQVSVTIFRGYLRLTTVTK